MTPFQWLRDVPVQTNKSLGVEGPKSGQFLPFKQQEEFHNLTSHVDHLMGRINSMTERMVENECFAMVTETASIF